MKQDFIDMMSASHAISCIEASAAVDPTAWASDPDYAISSDND